MSIESFIAKKVAKKVAKKAVKKIAKSIAPKIADKVINSDKTTKIIEKITGSNEIAKDTVNILSTQNLLVKLQNNGKITQDMLDALLSNNDEKLKLALREAAQAEMSGKPLPYLSKEKIDSALSIKKTITKSVANKLLNGIRN